MIHGKKSQFGNDKKKKIQQTFLKTSESRDKNVRKSGFPDFCNSWISNFFKDS